VKQRRPTMVRRHPESIHVANLVVNPDEGSSCRSVDQRTCLPVQPDPRVSVVSRVRPGHHRKPGQTQHRTDALIGFLHPGGRPDLLAGQVRQERPEIGIDSREERVRAASDHIFPRGTPERDQRSIDIEEQQRSGHRTHRGQSSAGPVARGRLRRRPEIACVGREPSPTLAQSSSQEEVGS
jgi:hypothetical protein